MEESYTGRETPSMGNSIFPESVDYQESSTNKTVNDGEWSTTSKFDEDPMLTQLLASLVKNMSANGTTEEPCFGDTLTSFGTGYKKFHGYIALFVCIFGALANTMIMIVLKRKEMRSPVNQMLLALAITDLFIMVEYIPFALHMYIINSSVEVRYSLGWARFVFFHVHFTQILHTISIQLTLSMAIWRYIALKCSNRSSTMCTYKRCHQVLAAAYICPLFFCILNYLYFQINKKVRYYSIEQPFKLWDSEADAKMYEAFCYLNNNFTDERCGTKKVEMYLVETSDLINKYPILHKTHFWTFSVLIKLIPCVVLTFFMCWLVKTLYKARKHHRMMERKTQIPLGVRNQGKGDAGSPECLDNKNPQGKKLLSTIQIKNPGSGASKPMSTIGDDLNTKGLIAEDHLSAVTIEGNNISWNCGTIGVKSPLLCPENVTTIIKNQSGIDGGKYDEDFEAAPLTQEDGDGQRNDNNPDVQVEQKNNHENYEGKYNKLRRFTKGFIQFPYLRRASASPVLCHNTDQGGKSHGKHSGSSRADRTSRMLMAVLTLFLLTEFPQGIIHFLTGWYGLNFFRCYYNSTAEIWDLLALFNSATNFILYCFMSKQFRTQFSLSFKAISCFRVSKWSISHCNNNATVSTRV